MKERELQQESRFVNLDHEGTSHFTYPVEPSSPQRSYNPNNYAAPAQALSIKSPYSQYSQNPKMNQPQGSEYDMTGLQWFNNNINNKQQSNYNPMAQQYKNQMRTNYGPQGNQSFDMEFMMPPDITSIDSDISKLLSLPYLTFLDKIGALTPSPFTDGPMDNLNYTNPNQYYQRQQQQQQPQQQFRQP